MKRLAASSLVGIALAANPCIAQSLLTQQLLGQIVTETKSRYQSASTELQKTAIRQLRKKALCDLGVFEVTDWYGVVKEVRSTNEGKAGLSVDMGPFKLIPVDGFFGDGNFVGPGSPTYDTLLTLKKGDKIAFHGRFHKSDKDCLREMSLTENGSMTSPDFIFDFTAIVPYK